jgi:hypothetical protein
VLPCLGPVRLWRRHYILEDLSKRRVDQHRRMQLILEPRWLSPSARIVADLPLSNHNDIWLLKCAFSNRAHHARQMAPQRDTLTSASDRFVAPLLGAYLCTHPVPIRGTTHLPKDVRDFEATERSSRSAVLCEVDPPESTLYVRHIRSLCTTCIAAPLGRESSPLSNFNLCNQQAPHCRSSCNGLSGFIAQALAWAGY